MQFKSPKDDDKYQWTLHVLDKMRYYGISESLIKRIIRFPKRIEEGIAEDTVAVMQSTPSKKNPQEIWVMYQIKGSKLKTSHDKLQSLLNNPKKIIISAWKFPGISPVGKPIAIPDDVLADLKKFMKIIVRVRPNKQKAAITKQDNGIYGVDIDAPAHDNKANKRLIEILASYFKVPKINIRVALGAKSKIKVIEML